MKKFLFASYNISKQTLQKSNSMDTSKYSIYCSITSLISPDIAESEEISRLIGFKKEQFLNQARKQCNKYQFHWEYDY